MARHESNALDARLSGQGEHLGEPRPSVERSQPYELTFCPSNSDLANALGEARRVPRRCSRSGRDVSKSAHVRDDAVAAEVIASGHDGNPRHATASRGARGGRSRNPSLASMVSTWGSPVERRSSFRSTRVSEVMRSNTMSTCGRLSRSVAPSSCDTATHRDDALGLMGVGNVLDPGRPAPAGLSSAFSRTQHVMKTAMSASSIVASRQGARRLEHTGSAFGIVFFVHLAAKGALPVCHAVKAAFSHLYVTSHHRDYARPHAAKMRGTVPRQTAAP